MTMNAGKSFMLLISMSGSTIFHFNFFLSFYFVSIAFISHCSAFSLHSSSFIIAYSLVLFFQTFVFSVRTQIFNREYNKNRFDIICCYCDISPACSVPSIFYLFFFRFLRHRFGKRKIESKKN